MSRGAPLMLTRNVVDDDAKPIKGMASRVTWLQPDGMGISEDKRLRENTYGDHAGRMRAKSLPVSLLLSLVTLFTIMYPPCMAEGLLGVLSTQIHRGPASVTSGIGSLGHSRHPGAHLQNMDVYVASLMGQG